YISYTMCCPSPSIAKPAVERGHGSLGNTSASRDYRRALGSTSGGRPVCRKFTTLLSRSNQNGAPNDKQPEEISQQGRWVSTSMRSGRPIGKVVTLLLTT